MSFHSQGGFYLPFSRGPLWLCWSPFWKSSSVLYVPTAASYTVHDEAEGVARKLGQRGSSLPCCDVKQGWPTRLPTDSEWRGHFTCTDTNVLLSVTADGQEEKGANAPVSYCSPRADSTVVSTRTQSLVWVNKAHEKETVLSLKLKITYVLSF